MTWEGRITFEVSSADPDSDSPVWVDFTQRVLDVVQAIDVATGRQDDLEGSSPTQFTLVLNNDDEALTYGNTSSPFASWWGPGRKCRLRETIGDINVMDLATGYLQTPSETLTTTGMEHRVTLSIVDRLARLGGGEPFISTLAAHIVYNGGSELKGYWTFGDATAPFRDLTGNQPPLDLDLNYPSNWATATTKPAFAYQAGVGAPGDDLTPVLFTPSNNYAFAYELKFPFGQGLSGSFANGEFLTLVFWLNLGIPPSGADTDELLSTAFFNGADLNSLRFYRSSSGFNLALTGGTMAANITTSGAPYATAIPIGIQVGIGPNSLKLWVGDVEYTTTPPGSPASPQNITAANLLIGWLSGSIWHCQLYTGSTFNRTAFLAQRNVGNTGLERQTTGERIRTIASYAGVRGGEMVIDTGTSVMTQANLAGQTPLDAMRDAERTEQGLLYVDGSGDLVFKDRRTLYNI